MSRDIAKVVRDKREEILRISSSHGAHNVRIFASVARGEAGPGSDVDFLVDMGPELSPWFPGGLLMDLRDLPGCKVDNLTEDALHW